jgi:hypothetical protein
VSYTIVVNTAEKRPSSEVRRYVFCVLCKTLGGGVTNEGGQMKNKKIGRCSTIATAWGSIPNSSPLISLVCVTRLTTCVMYCTKRFYL